MFGLMIAPGRSSATRKSIVTASPPELEVAIGF
jgi:hypothetical protein